ncbi:MAG TPA: hypothetical protein VH497_08420 [Vicinamibacterales bacterium]|jgi:quinol monooxygenase YgiN
MAVLVTAEVHGQTAEGFAEMVSALEPALRQSKGFIAVGGGMSQDGWKTFELWESQEDATQFFAKFVHPNLPDGIKPRRSMLQLNTLVKA